MIERLTLTDDVLKLIPWFNFTEDLTEEEISNKEYPRFGIDYNSIYGGSFLLEDLAQILGHADDFLPDSLENPTGYRYPAEIEEKMLSAHTFVMENLRAIEEIVHQFVVKGGITAGTYKCDHKIRLWEKENE